MSDRLIIETPEQIPLEFSLAGIGSRFLALAFDTLLQVLALFALSFIALLALGSGGKEAAACPRSGAGRTARVSLEPGEWASGCRFPNRTGAEPLLGL